MIQEIFIVEDTKEIICDLRPKFRSNKELVLKHMPLGALSKHLLDVPSLILINEDNIEEDILNVCKMIRDNEDNSATPIMVVSSNLSEEHENDILKKQVEYYIRKPYNITVLYNVMKNIIDLITINRGISPLTKLPR